ncbi:MFS general substrate transporter [Piedraia hortae CBS 480.64]|uniref:MFS general substrate transporter n=1 Tax=Piedraia hortae CBS 480.64 TaxID=1314780 RepID=A0A6A7C070_9PEZI|nr:MFS general substrate transporter [Piedraia hortae CBS 480.64]
MPPKPDSRRIWDRPSLFHRHSSALHHQLFSSARKIDRSRPMGSESDNDSQVSPDNDGHQTSEHVETPLPIGQLSVLAFIALAEQTALNSISPYLPDMASNFPEVGADQVGLCVGLLASSFALAQFVSNFAWGWLSDQIGRKPVVMIGTLLTAVCFGAFGFCRTLWQAILVQVFMGLVNGNQGVISTCVGEITDRSNQSRAFTYLPVIYGLGGITGPVVGGLLVMPHLEYPYLPPNLISAALLIVDLIVIATFLRESLEHLTDRESLGQRVSNLLSWLWQLASSPRPFNMRWRKSSLLTERSRLLAEPTGSDSDPEPAPVSMREVMTKDTILVLATFLIFQLSNVSYNSLYPIFAQAPPPSGRDLHSKEIGLSLAFAGAATILFQVGLFGRMRGKVGNKVTYRVSLAILALAFALTPMVGYKSTSELWLWAELGAVLILKTVATVGGLASAMLLVTNSAPSHAVLGALNGLAQTLSAAGRAVGPIVSGALFSAASRFESVTGGMLAFGVFGTVTAVGFLLSLPIRGEGLEDDWHGEEESGDV